MIEEECKCYKMQSKEYPFVLCSKCAKEDSVIVKDDKGNLIRLWGYRRIDYRQGQ